MFEGGTGNLQPDSRYFIAGTTKLYTTALIMNLRLALAIFEQNKGGRE